MHIAGVIAGLPGPESDWDSILTAGPHPAGSITLAALALDEGRLEQALADAVINAKKPDARLACAYLVGTIGWEVANAVVGLWLSGITPAAITADDVSLSTRWIDWDDEGTIRKYAVLDVNIDPAALVPGQGSDADLARIMIDLHTALIAVTAARTGLGVAAQWRLIGDGLSGALLGRGKAMDCAPRAMAIGQAILRTRGRLYSPQTDFVQVTVPADTPPDLARASDWFRLRGGCCRYYTEEDGEYCTTCVLRDRDDQITRLRDYLETTLAA